ncbi:MAG TPA: regulator, partial [Bacteroidota bacterium]|nr:regulator [Bacteroidota bacterium]
MTMHRFCPLSIVLLSLVVFSESEAQWVQPYGGPFFYTVYAIAVSDTHLFAGMYGGRGVCSSTDNGVTWYSLYTGLTSRNVRSLISSGPNLFVGTDSGVFRSTNKGLEWTVANAGLTAPYVYSFAVIGTDLFAGTYDNGVFRSTDDGASWVHTSFLDTVVHALAVSGTNLFAGTEIGVFRSTNNGTSWTKVNTGL